MGVDYTAKAGVGFLIGYGDEQKNRIVEVLEENKGNLDLIDFMEDFNGDFDLDYAGNYNYTGDKDDINILILKHNYKDNDSLFVENVNKYFDITLKQSDIDVVSDIEVW